MVLPNGDCLIFQRYSDPREIIADIDRSVEQLTDGEVSQLSREYERERYWWGYGIFFS